MLIKQPKSSQLTKFTFSKVRKSIYQWSQKEDAVIGRIESQRGFYFSSIEMYKERI